MGKIKKGILGGFSGKVGSVVGAFWKGIAYMRSMAGSIHNPQTDKQMKVRDKFGMLSHTLSKLQGFLKVGFHNKAVRMNELDAALKENFNNAVGGTWPNYEMLYDKLVVSDGKLEAPSNPSASVDGSTLSITWSDNSGSGNAKAEDTAMILVYNPSKEQAVYNLSAGERGDRQATISIPTVWNGDNVEVWLAMKSVDGDETSTSDYLGSISV